MTENTITSPRVLACCALLAIAALYVVGFVSNGVLRHFVQTLPLWTTVILGWRRSPWSKWTTLAWSTIWLALMVNIWLFLLGLPHLLGGSFTITETIMTIIVGASSAVAILVSLSYPSGVNALRAFGLFVAILVFQVLTIYVSFFSSIAHDR